MIFYLVNVDLNELGYSEAPKIVVTPPGPKSEELFSRIQTKIPQRVYGLINPVHRVMWESAKGDTVRDVDGNVYVDLTAGFHMANCGHSPPQVVDAVMDAASKFINSANWSFELRDEAANKLLSICPPELNSVVFGGASGSEATCGAVEAARLFT